MGVSWVFTCHPTAERLMRAVTGHEGEHSYRLQRVPRLEQGELAVLDWQREATCDS